MPLSLVIIIMTFLLFMDIIMPLFLAFSNSQRLSKTFPWLLEITRHPQFLLHLQKNLALVFFQRTLLFNESVTTLPSTLSCQLQLCWTVRPQRCQFLEKNKNRNSLTTAVGPSLSWGDEASILGGARGGTWGLLKRTQSALPSHSLLEFAFTEERSGSHRYLTLSHL